MTWVKAGPKDAGHIEDFLRKYEAYCIHLCESYIREGRQIIQKGGMLVRLESGGISGIIGTDHNGHLYPCLLCGPDSTEMKTITGYLKKLPKIVSSMGTSDSVDILSELIPVSLYRKIDYDLMRENGHLGQSADGILSIREMKTKDIAGVFPLQEGYEKEEVLLNPENFNRTASLMLLQKRLKQYPHYIGRHDGEIVTMARINAMSWNLYQIGGVYTLPAFRSRGFGGEIMRYTMDEIHSKGRSALLFVKKTNSPAISLYRKLKFSKISDFSIAYFG